jgi:hypothetical protein
MKDKIKDIIQTLGGMLLCILPIVFILWVWIYNDLTLRILITNIVAIIFIYIIDKGTE